MRCELFLMKICSLGKMKYHRLLLFMFVRCWTAISLLGGLGVEDQQNGLYVISFFGVE